jgi:hypothetical protein
MYLQFCLRIANDMKIDCSIKNVVDFILLQSDIDCIRKWCLGM